MTKWVALALGALLALGGAVSIWNGVDVIQSERGWVSVIAGSVALVGGVLTFALFILIREVEALRGMAAGSAAPAVERSASATFEAPAPSAPVFHEPPAPAGSVSPPPFSPAIPAPPARPTPPPRAHEPEPVVLAHESQTFEQIFPPAPPVAGAPAPKVAASGHLQASETVAAVAGVAAGGILARAPVGPPPVVQLPPETPAAQPSEPEPQAELELAQEPAPEPVPQSPAPAAEERIEAADADEVSTECHVPEEPAQEEAPADESQTPLVSPGYAWLERALAREEGRKSPALDWLRSRPPTGSLTEPPVSSHEASGQEPAHDEEPAHHQAPATAEAPEHDQEASVADHTEAGPGAEEHAPEPDVVGRYSSGGSHYTLYSDGSIDAQTDHGIFRFASMADLRAHIESGNAGSGDV